MVNGGKLEPCQIFSGSAPACLPIFHVVCLLGMSGNNVTAFGYYHCYNIDRALDKLGEVKSHIGVSIALVESLLSHVMIFSRVDIFVDYNI